MTLNRMRGLPDVYPVARRLALLHGQDRIVSIGPAPIDAAAVVDPRVRLVAVSPGIHSGRERPLRPFAEAWSWDVDGPAPPVEPRSLDHAVLICSGILEQIADPGPVLQLVQGWLERAPVAIITRRLDDPPGPAPFDIDAAAHLDRFGDLLESKGLKPTFLGWTATTAAGRAKTTAMAIVDRVVGSAPAAAPSGFRVTAIMAVYNESDVVGPAIEALIGDGVLVHVIDNWSTDGTDLIARRYLGRGVIAVERFPERPSGTFDLLPLLGRVEEVAAASDTDWVIVHDADERRTPPWAGMSLRDGLWAVDRSGFSAVDHTVMNFRPVDDGYTPGSSFEDHFPWFEFGTTPDMLLQVKAWRRTPGTVVDLRTTGGHDATFAGRRIFPYKFVLKHYPIRSQEHGERKVFVDRGGRWNASERAKGLHVHYDQIVPGQAFLRDPASLARFDPATGYATYLGEIVAGAGLAPDVPPAWARKGPLRRRLHELGGRLVVGTGLDRRIARATGRLPAPIRDRLVRAKRALLG